MLPRRPGTASLTREEPHIKQPAGTGSTLARIPRREVHSRPERPAGEAPAAPDPGRRRASARVRYAAAGAVVAAVLVVAVLLATSGSTYTVRADFQDASGLVNGNQVLIGPATVGSVQSIGLTPNGLAQVTMSVDSDAAPLHQGTVARIRQNSLSGIANRYVVLEPGPTAGPQIPSGGTIPLSDSYSMVSLDQLFDTFDPLTRAGLRGFIRGEAASLQGKGLAANQTLQYLAPGLASTSAVTAELTRDEPAFDALVVQGAQALQALASRATQLADLVASTDTATGAIASQSQALQQALSLLPGTLTHSTSTFAGLDTTLDALDPVVAQSKPAVRQLGQFASALRTVADEALPVLPALNGLIGTGGLTTLAQQTPALADIAAAAFPRLVAELNASQPQLDYLRDYTPDVVAALANIGQASAYYDANGHYVRTQPFFNAFSIDASNQLVPNMPSQRYDGLQVARARCPGAAVQPTPDRSAPYVVPGCNPADTPPGP